jgi:hypothetical protein
MEPSPECKPKIEATGLILWRHVGVALSIAALLADPSAAMARTAKGVVIDNRTQTGVNNASVTILDQNEAKTNADGEYEIQIPTDTDGKDFLVKAKHPDYDQPFYSQDVHNNGQVVRVPAIRMQKKGDLSMNQQHSQGCCCCCCCADPPRYQQQVSPTYVPSGCDSNFQGQVDPIRANHNMRLLSASMSPFSNTASDPLTPSRLRPGVDFPIREVIPHTNYDEISLSFRYGASPGSMTAMPPFKLIAEQTGQMPQRMP